MDMDQEAAKVKVILGGGLLFLFSLFMSWTELRYMLTGKTVDAPLGYVRVETETDRRGYTYRRKVVEYVFQDGENSRREYAAVALDWQEPANRVVQVQYIPGAARRSRLAGQSNVIWVVVFGASVALMVFLAIRTWRQAYT